MYGERWRPGMPGSDQWALGGDYVMNLYFTAAVGGKSLGV